MSVYCRPFKVSDFEAFEPIEPMVAIERYDPEFAQAIEDSGLAVTGIRNGEIVGSGGVHPIENDDFNGEMWLRLSKTCQIYPMDTLRWIKEGMAIIEQVYPFKQLNATIRCCFKKSIKLVEHLGFVLTETKEYEGQQWAVYSKRIQG